MTPTEAFDAARHAAARTLVWISCGLLPLVCLAAWIAGTPVWLAGGISAAFSGAALAALPRAARSPGSPPRRPSSASRSR